MKPVIHIMIDMGHIIPDVSFETTTDKAQARKRLRHLNKHFTTSVYLQHANGDIEASDGEILHPEPPLLTQQLKPIKPTCASCQHWGRQGLTGLCQKHKTNEHAFGVFIHPFAMNTSEKFGCIHHTPKVEKEYCVKCAYTHPKNEPC